MKLSIRQEEINELLKVKLGAKSEIHKGKLVISAMLGTVKFSVKAPKVPTPFNKPVDFDISMSLTVKMFLDRIQQELKKRELGNVINVTPTKLSVDLRTINGNMFIDWLKTKMLKRLEFENGEISIEV